MTSWKNSKSSRRVIQSAPALILSLTRIYLKLLVHGHGNLRKMLKIRKIPSLQSETYLGSDLPGHDGEAVQYRLAECRVGNIMLQQQHLTNVQHDLTADCLLNPAYKCTC